MDIKISIGADHGGYEMKQILKEWIQVKIVLLLDKIFLFEYFIKL
jgi:ribose 5-phosphate isomerase RpiB